MDAMRSRAVASTQSLSSLSLFWGVCGGGEAFKFLKQLTDFYETWCTNITI
jgi:hypothetical protein